MEDEFKNKKILVTGGTGSLGKVVVEKLLSFGPKEVRILDIDEDEQFHLSNKYRGRKDIQILFGDIRDKDRLRTVMEDIDIVFHFAALKHVMGCEYNPFEAIKTNIYGMQNVIEAALENNVKKVIFSSSDKAASPDNTLGATKLLGERLMISANQFKGKNNTVFACVRFGNIMGTRGSVIPLFTEQIKKGQNITVTNPNMTRFMISLDEALNLIFKCTKLARGGEIFIFKMPVVKVGDLANTMLSYHGKNRSAVMMIGPRPGETLSEELMAEEESNRAIETDDFFIIAPFRDTDLDEFCSYFGGKKLKEPNSYDSHNENPIAENEIIELLKKNSLLN